MSEHMWGDFSQFQKPGPTMEHIAYRLFGQTLSTSVHKKIFRSVSIPVEDMGFKGTQQLRADQRNDAFAVAFPVYKNVPGDEINCHEPQF